MQAARPTMQLRGGPCRPIPITAGRAYCLPSSRGATSTSTGGINFPWVDRITQFASGVARGITGLVFPTVGTLLVQAWSLIVHAALPQGLPPSAEEVYVIATQLLAGAWVSWWVMLTAASWLKRPRWAPAFSFVLGVIVLPLFYCCFVEPSSAPAILMNTSLGMFIITILFLAHIDEAEHTERAEASEASQETTLADQGKQMQ